MAGPAALNSLLTPASTKLVHYQSMRTLLDFLIFVQHLSHILSSHPRVSISIDTSRFYL